AEQAARTAVASTLGSIPSGTPDLSGFKRDIDDLKALHGATDRRNRDTLEAVHTTLEKLVERLSSLETETGRPRTRAAGGARAGAETGSLAQEAVAKIDAAAKAQAAPAFALAEGDRPLPPAASGDEVLLEPGLRPIPSAATGAQAASEMKAALIAQARRAAQAAAVETAAATKGRAKGIDMAALAAAASGTGASGMAARVRQAIDKRRRPILLGLAAIVLAIGTLQVVSGFVGGSKRPTVTAAAPARIEAPAVAPAPAPAAREVPARDVLAAPAPAEASPPAPAPDSGARDKGAGLPKPGEPVRVASADGVPATTGALPASPTAAAAAAAVPEAPPLGPIPNMASVGDIPASAGPPGLRAAALAGDPAAVFELASRAADGRGMMRDLKLAARLFERAAAHGLVPAQFRIANHYEKGLGLPKDTALAKAWYQRAADKGNARAMHNLAVLLAEGVGGKPDYAAAADWFRRAAEHGVRDSQFNLAVLMARGLGTKQDLPGAFTWFDVAARQGDDDAGKKREEVATRLTPSELALARASAERWRPEIPPRAANEVALPANGWAEAPAPAAAPAKPAKKI
ncbi:MAG TPA: tetratricopeptide repeat protein, partial [Salinarimonas sp.]|nr:tetratricopeptide repeat protein [Salinarimonas sp.]